ncbi:MAG: flagellin, partial [Pseudomonadota bacterium]
MSSILTNNSAMVALQTLNMINKNLASTQNEISTGKRVATARDDAAIWAIAQTMSSDVSGFEAISKSLDVGSASVAVARTSAETVSNLVSNIRDKIIEAQDPSSDRATIQNDINDLRNQVQSVVGAAQFNGLNLINGSQTATNVNGNAGVNVLASLDRDTTGNVTAGQIGVDAQNLSLTAGTALVGAAGDSGTVAGANAYQVSGATAGTGAVAFDATNQVGYDATTGDGFLAALEAGNDDTVIIGAFDFQVAGADTGGAAAIDPVTG